MKRSRAYVCIFSIMILIFNPAIVWGQAGNPKEPFTIVLSAETPSVKSGLPIRINFQLTNNTTHGIKPGWGGQDSLGPVDYLDTFDVRDAQGRPLQRRKPNPNGPLLGNLVVDLDPGTTRNYGQDFSRWYDMSKPGAYTIQATRPFSEGGKKGVVTSNKLTITVTK
jgi:hypothetical protein